MAHGVGSGASGEIDDADDVAIVDVVRSMKTVNRNGIVPIQAASADSVEIGHTLLHYFLLHYAMARWCCRYMVTCYLLTYCMTSHYVRHMAQQDSIVLSLRLPAKLVKRLDTLAERELRTRVNMIHVLLQEALNNREQGK